MLKPIFLTLTFSLLFTGTGLTLNHYWGAETATGAGVTTVLNPASGAAPMTPQVPTQTSASSSAQTISVVVTGAVHQPGVYQLPVYSRVQDLVDLAGGLTAEADLMPRGYWDQSLYAGQILHVAGQRASLATGTELPIVKARATRQPKVTARLKKRSRQQTPLRKAPLQKIDLNKASLKDLQKLPGVGPALAKRIVKARTEKPFARPEDLVRVKGIGPAKFKKMADWVK